MTKPLTPEQIAKRKFRERNPEKTRLWSYRSHGKKYIKEYANEKELEEFIELIKNRYKELGKSTKN